MTEETHENATEELRRALTMHYADINWQISRLSEQMPIPHRELKVRDIDRKLKPAIVYFVRLASFNEGFQKDIMKLYKPYGLETQTPTHGRKPILIHARRTIQLWEAITRALRVHEIILLPGA